MQAVKLKHKFILFIGLGVIIASVLVGFLAIDKTRKVVREGVGKSQLELARYSMNSLSRLLYERYLDIQDVPEEMRRYISGDECGDSYVQEARSRLQEIKNTSGMWYELSLVTRDGLISTSTNEMIIGNKMNNNENPNSYKAFQASLKGDIYYSDLVRSKFIGRETIVFSAPVRNKESRGMIDGVVIGHFAWPVILEMFEEIKGPLIHLYNQQGIVIVTNDPTHRKGILIEDHSDKLAVQHALFSEDEFMDVEGVHGKEMVLAAFVGESGHLDYLGNDWGLVAEIPVKTVYAQANELAMNTLIIIIPTIVMFAGAALLLILKMVMSPIAELTTASKAIIGGDLSKRVKNVGNDEIGQLGSMFNQMTQTLQKLYGGLEKQVTEKTTQLAEKVNKLQEQGKKQNRTKKAMINLLEDARELERELKFEKEDVEKKVQKRTIELSKQTKALEESRQRATAGWVQLQAEKARLNASMEVLPLGLIIIDKNYNVVECNKELKKILGREIIGEFKIEEFEAFLQEIGLSLEKTYEHHSQEKTIKEENLEYKEKFLKLISVPVILESDVIGITYLIEDITEMKKLQKTRDEFFSVASHELRTPLTAIRGNTQMLQDYYPEIQNNAEVKGMVADIHTASVRLIGIVNDFLDASRLELKKTEMKFSQFSLKELVEKTMEQVNPESVGRELEYKLDVSEGIDFTVKADKDRLQQVLINLIGNAFKFTKEGGVYIGIENGNEGFLKVSITDTGVGMSEADQTELFAKFKQVGSNAGLARDVSQGTGMGLYISKLIMEAEGGRVYLEKSEIGKGSTFAIEVPKVG